MNRIYVSINAALQDVPDLQELLPKELEAARLLKEQGVLEHVFAKSDGQTVVLIFKDVDLNEAKRLVLALPLAPYFSTVEYSMADKHF